MRNGIGYDWKIQLIFIVFHCSPVTNDLRTSTGPRTWSWGPLQYSTVRSRSIENVLFMRIDYSELQWDSKHVFSQTIPPVHMTLYQFVTVEINQLVNQFI